MSTIGKKIIIPGADFSGASVAKYIQRTIPLIAIPYAYSSSSSTLSALTYRATTYGNIKAGDTLELINPDSTFDNQFLVYEVDPSGTPEFTDGMAPEAYSETFVGYLKPNYSAEAYTFTEDCRFLAVMRDNLNNTTRDFTEYCPFGLYNIRREYKTGEAVPVHTYYGTYDANTSNFRFGGDSSLRSFAMLDLKAGDVVSSADVDTFAFLVLKMQDGTVKTYESTLRQYDTASWVSETEQRVLVAAKNLSNPEGIVTDDLNNVLKVTFNS